MFIQNHAAYSLHNLTEISSRMVIQILVKISHITMDLVSSLAFDKTALGISPQLCIIWIWMRPTGVWIASVDRDHAFWGQHLLQLGTRLDCLTVVCRVPCARVLWRAARLKGEDYSIIDSFCSMIIAKSFYTLKSFHTALYGIFIA